VSGLEITRNQWNSMKWQSQCILRTFLSIFEADKILFCNQLCNLKFFPLLINLISAQCSNLFMSEVVRVDNKNLSLNLKGKNCDLGVGLSLGLGFWLSNRLGLGLLSLLGLGLGLGFFLDLVRKMKAPVIIMY
jgi:hypothetical protein